jgi:hypothetical protein
MSDDFSWILYPEADLDTNQIGWDFRFRSSTGEVYSLQNFDPVSTWSGKMNRGTLYHIAVS